MNIKTTFLALSIFANTCQAATSLRLSTSSDLASYAGQAVSIAPYNKATDEQAITGLIKITVDAYLAELSDMKSKAQAMSQDEQQSCPMIPDAEQAVGMMLEAVNNPDLHATFVLKEEENIVGFIVADYNGAFPDETEVMASISHFTVLGNNPRGDEYRHLLLAQAIKEIAADNVVNTVRWIMLPEFSMCQDYVSVFVQHGFEHVDDFYTLRIYELHLNKK